MWFMKTLLTSRCTNQQGAGQLIEENSLLQLQASIAVTMSIDGHKRIINKEGLTKSTKLHI